MPWKDVSVMDQKREFINLYISGAYSLSELCRAFNISRPTARKYANRFKEMGDPGLNAQSRAPHHIPLKTEPEIERAICEYRRQKPTYGIEKILRILKNKYSEDRLPALSTGNLILKRNGLIIPKKRFRRVEPVHPIFDPSSPNEVWSGDFKGKFKMGNGVYCSPLTLADSFSRLIFTAKGMHEATYEGCRKEYEEVFREYGMPWQLHTDNGPPFGCVASLCRLTRLAVWLIELGIEPVYSDPGHPEQNGRHERMHRDLKAEATRPPGYNLQAQQRKLNAFRIEYNEVRPHSALNLETPSKIHVRSERNFPEKIEVWEYPKEMKIRRVCRNGAIRWGHSHWVGVSTTLMEKNIGLEELGDGIWGVYFRQKRLGYFNEKYLRIHDQEGRFKRNRV
jgi:transposase InsO family protein